MIQHQQQQQQTNLTSFSPINRNQNVQLPQSILDSKRTPASSNISASAMNLSYTPNISTTYSSVLSPIFSHLASKYRHSTNSSNNFNIEHSIEELKSAFFHLEQQNPGACDLFVKYLFQYLKPSN
jgi:hypothetical protein